MDVLAVLCGSAISSGPGAHNAQQLLSSLPTEPVEALRIQVLEDLLDRRLRLEDHAASLWNQQDQRWMVCAVGGT